MSTEEVAHTAPGGDPKRPHAGARTDCARCASLTATTPTLADFLLARIAEDEYNARDSTGYLSVLVKRDCEAKRKIVGYLAEAIADGEHHDTYFPYEEVCLTLAAVHADHPDWREEWRL